MEVVAALPCTSYATRTCRALTCTIYTNQLARSLRISLPTLAGLQFALTLAGFIVWLAVWISESWNEEEYDKIYYTSIPFWFVQLVVLW